MSRHALLLAYLSGVFTTVVLMVAYELWHFYFLQNRSDR